MKLDIFKTASLHGDASSSFMHDPVLKQMLGNRVDPARFRRHVIHCSKALATDSPQMHHYFCKLMPIHRTPSGLLFHEL